MDLSGDTMFSFGIDVTAKLHARSRSAGPTYFQHITYPAKHSLNLFRTDHTIADPPYQVLK